MASEIDQEMSNYFKQLNDAEKQSVLQMLKTFLIARKDHTERISVEQYNKEIDEAMERAGKGEFTTVEDLEKEMQSW
jgi:hypothetical protein